MKEKVLYLILCLILVTVMLIGCKSVFRHNRTQRPAYSIGGAAKAEEEASAREIILCDQSGIKISAKRLGKGAGDGWELEVKIGIKILVLE